MDGIFDGFKDEWVRLYRYYIRDTETKEKTKDNQTYIGNSGKYSVVPLFTLLFLIKKWDIHILHTHHKKGFYFAQIAKIVHPKIILIHHEHGDILVSNALYKIFLRVFKKNTSFFIAVSDYVEIQLKKMVNIPSNKIITLLNFVDLRNTIQKNQYRLHAGHEIVVGFVGRLAEVKGCEYLIRAIPSVLETNRLIKVIIAGDGPEEDRLKSLVSKLGLQLHVSFIGVTKSFADVADLVDMVVIPSKSESSSLVLLEAWASRVPVIISELPALKTVVEDNRNAITFPVGNIVLLAQKIVNLSNDEVLAARLTSNALHQVEKRDLQSYIVRLKAVYKLFKHE